MKLFLTASTAALIVATPALADLTAEDVLANHVTLLGMGGEVDITPGQTATSGNGLTV